MFPGGPEGISDSDWDRLQAVITDFESAWGLGERPNIVDYLPADEPHREALLVELVYAELEFRLKSGDSARVENYLHRFPTLARDRATVLGLIQAECSFRRRREPDLTFVRYRERFPEFRDELLTLEIEATTVITPMRSSLGGSSLPEPPLPRSLGKYELKQRLGSGSFGVVYRALDTVLKREVAVKIAGPQAIASELEIRACLREARNAIELRHPNIVAIYDAGSIEGTVCLVRDFIEGSTLAERLREVTFSPLESASLMIQVAEALDHAHQRGIIHRDLKPSNILLDRQGRPHVSDFGLAKRESSDTTIWPSGAGGSTGPSGARLGTLSYSSPEQALGDSHKIDHRSDVYSAGVVLYEMLTGSLPFQGRGRMLENQIQEQEPPPLRSRDEGIPAALEAICLKALAKDRGARYQNAKEMASDLRVFVDRKPIGSVPKPSRRFGPGSGKRLTFPIMATLSALLLALAVSIGVGLRSEGRRSRDAEGFEGAVRALLDLTRQGDDPDLAEFDRKRPLGRRAWEHARRLAPALEGDPVLLGVEADTQIRLAEWATINGSDREAGPHWVKAVELCEKLVRQAPDPIPRRADLARSLAALARVRDRAGESAEAQRLFKRSEELRNGIRDEKKRGASQKPGDLGRELDAIEASLDASEVAIEAGEDPKLPDFKPIAGKLVGRDASVRLRLADLASRSARLQLADRQPERAIEAAELAFGIDESIPGNREPEVGMARTILIVGQAHRDLDNGDLAREKFREAAGRFRRLVEFNPFDPGFRRDLATALFEEGRLLDRPGSRSEAIVAYRKALFVHQELMRIHPDNRDDLARRGEIRAAIASALDAEDRSFPAAWNYFLASAAQAQVVVLAPGVDSHRRKLGQRIAELNRIVLRGSRSSLASGWLHGPQIP